MFCLSFHLKFFFTSLRFVGSCYVFLLLGQAAFAATVPIYNHSFENDFAAPNTFPVLVPDGWTVIDVGGIVDQNRDAVGVINPTGSTFFPGGAPDGNNAALIYLETEAGSTPVGLGQTLSDVLLANTTYTLQVEVGNIASGVGASTSEFFNLNGFPGYRIQFLAGGQLLAEDDDGLTSSLPGGIPEGEFALSTVQFTAGATHPQLGQALEIRLFNKNQIDSPDPGIEVDFDNVRLDAIVIPEPASLVYFFGSVLLFGGSLVVSKQINIINHE